MSCKCIKCQKPCDCEWKTCDLCYMEDCCKTTGEKLIKEVKNLSAGGRFYGEIKDETKSES